MGELKQKRMKINRKQIGSVGLTLCVVVGLFCLNFHDLIHVHEDSSAHHDTNLPNDTQEVDDCIYCLLNTESLADFTETRLFKNEKSSFLSALSTSRNDAPESLLHFSLRAPPALG